jgi:nifR3 family TIM-barrel protein
MSYKYPLSLQNPLNGRLVNLSSRFISAPMAGISNMAFRLAVKEHGAGLVCTEMISAQGIIRKNPKTARLLDISPYEHPVSIQIFGRDADVMADAAKTIEEKADVIDLNFGCPARKIVSSGSGAAIMRQPKLLEDIVSKVVKSVSCPVTAKIRSGWDKGSKNFMEISHIAEGSGAAAVIIHPRTRSRGFSGRSDWNIITELKESVSIPVIGNGDVNTPEDAKNMLKTTGCDGVMIGRGALGNPWIFSRSVRYLETGIIPPLPDYEEILQHLLMFTRSLIELKGEYSGCREIRKFVKWYTKGMPEAKEIRQACMRVESYRELESLVMSYIRNYIYEGVKDDLP